MSGSKHKSSGDVAGTAKKRQAITMETKEKIIEKMKRQEEEEVTEEQKRFTMQVMERGFSLFEVALLVSEAQDPNIEQYTKVAAAFQNAIQCYHVNYDEKKELLPRRHWIIFSRRQIELNPARNQNLCKQHQA